MSPQNSYGQQQGQYGQNQQQQDQQGGAGGDQQQQPQSKAGPGGKPLQQFPALLVNKRYHLAPIVVHNQQEADDLKVDWTDWEVMPPQGDQAQQQPQYPQLIYNVNLPPMIVGSAADMAALNRGPNSEWHIMTLPQPAMDAAQANAQAGGDSGPGLQVFFGAPAYQPTQPPQGGQAMGQTQEMQQRYQSAQAVAEKLMQALEGMPGGAQQGQQGGQGQQSGPGQGGGQQPQGGGQQPYQQQQYP